MRDILRKKSITINTVVGLDAAISKTTKNTLLVLDEADFHLLDESDVIIDKMMKLLPYGILGLSATFPDGMTKELFELEERLGFKVRDSMVKDEDFCHFLGNQSLIEFL